MRFTLTLIRHSDHTIADRILAVLADCRGGPPKPGADDVVVNNDVAVTDDDAANKTVVVMRSDNRIVQFMKGALCMPINAINTVAKKKLQ